MSSLVRRLAVLPVVADGSPAVLVRLALVLAAGAVLSLGIYHLPSFATTRGELVIGLLLSLAVAVQLAVAAFCFPLGCRK